MYQRFRIWVDSDMAEQTDQRPFNVPPSPPESANLERAEAPQVPESPSEMDKRVCAVKSLTPAWKASISSA